MELTHASFFSGVGGLDLGLERAGWRTVSFSEIDPYASAVLAERWPGVPNLGDIVALADRRWSGQSAESTGVVSDGDVSGAGRKGVDGCAWSRASLWSGGFPCQDLSVAGKRAGFAGERSSLAFAFLDLVERHRPPAILLENVPGLLSSNGGRDFGALLSRLAELGYGWAYRILDAQFSGVPQRRRRVFIVALNLERGFGADSAAEVLSVGSRCDGHSATSDTPRPAASDGLAAGFARSLSTSQWRIDADTESFIVAPPVRAGGHGDPGIGRDNDHDRLIVSPSPDPGGMRTSYELARWLDNRPVAALDTKQGGADDNEAQAGHLVTEGFAQNQRGELRELGGVMSQLTTGGGKPGEGYPAIYTKRARVSGPGTPETWEEGGPMSTLNSFDVGDIRTTAAVLDTTPADSELLPLGLDSHRYRCCGNGVVSNVSEWIGVRLAAALGGAA